MAVNRNRLKAEEEIEAVGKQVEATLKPSAFSLQPDFPPPIDLTGGDILSRVKDYLQKGVDTLKKRHRGGVSGH